ncbi:MAG: diguanylate cyclase [Brevinematia bacterium]
MLEAREFLVKSIGEKFLKPNYITELENIFSKFKESNTISEKDLNFLCETTRIVFGLDLGNKDVLEHWTKILSVKNELESYDIRVIAFDYFLNKKLINNPKIIEIEKFFEVLEFTFQDHKTFAYNYYMLKLLANYEIEKIKRYGGSFSILMIDLDNFKYYNDTYGHQFGDELLNEFSRIVLSCIRRSDLLFRYGGDEFIVFLPETKRIGARFVAEKIKESVFQNFKSKNIDITTSIGISVYPFDGETFEDIIEVADRMMYFSKKHGKNKVSDKFDYVEESDRRRYPRIYLDKRVNIFLKIDNDIFRGVVIDISKSGILVKLDLKPKELGDLVEINKISINDSEYFVNVLAKISRVDDNFIALDFKENRILETIMYILSS